MSIKTTWKPHTKHGELDSKERDELPDSVFAFPKQRKEPLTDASHVKNALARFDQVEDVSDKDRDLAFANIKRRQSITRSMSRRRTGINLAKSPIPKIRRIEPMVHSTVVC
jgi:hypothetical protein